MLGLYNMSQLVALLLLVTVVLADQCLDSCTLVCTDTPCSRACVSKCQGSYRFGGTPHFRLELIQLLPEGTIVTGSDSPSNPRTKNIYFTTLDGRVYRYNSNNRRMTTAYTLPEHQLDVTNNKGLYDIAFHRDFDKNSLVYLHFSAPKSPDSDDRFRDHDNVVVECKLTGLNIDQLQEVKRIPQYTSERSGGWMKMGLRDQVIRGKAWLYIAVGGNKEELISRTQGSPALSTIYSIADPDDQSEISERVWASGVQNPLDCEASIFKAGRIVCLVEDTKGLRHVHSLRKGYNYGSDAYVRECIGHACAQQYSALASRDSMVSFNVTECPVESIQMYTGHDMRNYKLDLFLSRSACYTAGEFKPAEILRIYRDHANNEFKTIAMPTDLGDDLLVNTTFVGADKLDEFYIAGYALRTGHMGLYQIVPIKAAE